jgi:hypothetical protein
MRLPSSIDDLTIGIGGNLRVVLLMLEYPPKIYVEFVLKFGEPKTKILD